MMFAENWCTEACFAVFDKGHTTTDAEDPSLPQDIQVLDLVGDAYALVTPLIPGLAARSQAGQDYACDGRLFSMLCGVWWAQHNNLQKRRRDDVVAWLRVGCKKQTCKFLKRFS